MRKTPGLFTWNLPIQVHGEVVSLQDRIGFKFVFPGSSGYAQSTGATGVGGGGVGGGVAGGGGGSSGGGRLGGAGGGDGGGDGRHSSCSSEGRQNACGPRPTHLQERKTPGRSTWNFPGPSSQRMCVSSSEQDRTGLIPTSAARTQSTGMTGGSDGGSDGGGRLGGSAGEDGGGDGRHSNSAAGLHEPSWKYPFHSQERKTPGRSTWNFLRGNSQSKGVSSSEQDRTGLIPTSAPTSQSTGMTGGSDGGSAGGGKGGGGDGPHRNVFVGLHTP